jgi:hypothetical protein
MIYQSKVTFNRDSAQRSRRKRRARCGGVAIPEIRDGLEGKKVALIMSGGNLDHEHLLQALG